MNANVKVIGLTRLGIKPESTATEADAPYHSAILAVMKYLVALKMLAFGKKIEIVMQPTQILLAIAYATALCHKLHFATQSEAHYCVSMLNKCDFYVYSSSSYVEISINITVMSWTK